MLNIVTSNEIFHPSKYAQGARCIAVIASDIQPGADILQLVVFDNDIIDPAGFAPVGVFRSCGDGAALDSFQAVVSDKSVRRHDPQAAGPVIMKIAVDDLESRRTDGRDVYKVSDCQVI